MGCQVHDSHPVHRPQLLLLSHVSISNTQKNVLGNSAIKDPRLLFRAQRSLWLCIRNSKRWSLTAELPKQSAWVLEREAYEILHRPPSKLSLGHNNGFLDRCLGNLNYRRCSAFRTKSWDLRLETSAAIYRRVNSFVTTTIWISVYSQPILRAEIHSSTSVESELMECREYGLLQDCVKFVGISNFLPFRPLK